MTILLKLSLSMFLEIPEESDQIPTEPHWIDKNEYPFKPQFYSWNGEKLHYVDEGTGPPIVLLHGNPTWSFLYRNFIKQLSVKYRCVVPDYPGFGLSGLKDNIPYRPEKVAEIVHDFINYLNLKDVSLVLHDWGGPIGMWYAVSHPDNLASIVVMNSWMWPLDDQLRFQIFSRLMNSFPVKYLINQHNIFTRLLMKFGFGNPLHYTQNIQQHYMKPFDNFASRNQQSVFASCLLDSSPWLESIWKMRDAVEDIPAISIWGMRDPMITKKMLSRWSTIFESIEMIRLKRAGHYIPEEIGNTEFVRIENFLSSVYS